MPMALGACLLHIWRTLEVRRGPEHQKFYAYKESVFRAEYALFEHFGDGLWARCAILLESRFTPKGKSDGVAKQCLATGAFLVEVATTHTVHQMALVKKCSWQSCVYEAVL